MSLRRAHVVLALLVGGGAAVAAGSRTWVEASSAADGPLGPLGAQVTGAQAAPLVTAAALVALAAGGALALSGRVTRLVALVLGALAGIGVLVPTVAVLTSPAGAALRGLAEGSGVFGGIDPQGVRATTTAWPVVALVAGVVVVVAATAGLTQARRWDAVTRFESPGSAPVRAGTSPGDDWDALTRDEDPTREPPGRDGHDRD